MLKPRGSEILLIPQQWRDEWKDVDWFEKIFSLQGDEYRNMDGRRTLRFDLLGQSYFVKMYSGLGWRRILKSLMRFRTPPILSAYSELRAINILTELGIDTMSVVAYGERGRSPAMRQSFLVTEDLNPARSLEDVCRDWQHTPPKVAFKRALLARIAEVTRTLHTHGINHRDYYLCHFLLDTACERSTLDPAELRIFLIDLHRVQFRKRVPRRWRIKDLASIYFSALDSGLTRRDCLRFIRIYTSGPLRESLSRDKRLWRQVEKRAARLYRRYQLKYADI
jgi:heptose I phosphotransferase